MGLIPQYVTSSVHTMWEKLTHCASQNRIFLFLLCTFNHVRQGTLFRGWKDGGTVREKGVSRCSWDANQVVGADQGASLSDRLDAAERATTGQVVEMLEEVLCG